MAWRCAPRPDVPKNVFFGVATGKPSGRAIPDAPSAYRGAPRPTKIGSQRNPVETKPFVELYFLQAGLTQGHMEHSRHQAIYFYYVDTDMQVHHTAEL